MKFRIKYADRIVGLFVLIAAVGFAGGTILLGINHRWFAKDYHYITQFNSASGATAGTAIMMKGFQVGKIERASLNDGNTVDADVVIYDTYISKVRENSILELVTSPIGLGTQLLFHPGKSPTLLKEKSFIPLADSETGLDLIDRGLVDIPPKDDTITRLLSNVNPLLENVNKTVVTANRTLTEINRALAGQSSGPLGSIVSDASSAMSKVNGLVGGVSGDVESLVAKANDLVASLNVITKNLEATTEAMRDPTGLVPKLLDAKGSVKSILEDNNALYDKMMSSLDYLQTTLDNFKAISASLNAQMPSIAVTLAEGRDAIQKAQDVLEGLKNNPLLKGGVPARSDQQSIYQGLRDGSF